MSQLFIIFVIAVSAFVVAFGCQSPTVLVPGERGPMGQEGIPGQQGGCQSPTVLVPGERGPMGQEGIPGQQGVIDIVLNNRTLFASSAGKRKRREMESQILLTLEDIPAGDVETTANNLIKKIVNFAEKDSSIKHRIDEVFFETAEAKTDGYKYDITFLFQKESSKICKNYIEAVKKVNRLMGKLQTLTMTCQGEIY
uniref:Uncharacterized protein n=1 Tax=Panagrolaimus sp. ES5 TaxID=591445 RepID=A0AC34GUY3_9BILA